MTGEIQRLRAKVVGRVQGVSFRYYTVLRAKELDITGWVSNLDDGSVEVVAEATREQLDDFLIFLHEGSTGAVVKQVEVQWSDASNEFSDFNVR